MYGCHQWQTGTASILLVWSEPASIASAHNATLLWNCVLRDGSQNAAPDQPWCKQVFELCTRMRHSYCSQICPSRDPMLTARWTILASHVTVGSHMLVASLLAIVHYAWSAQDGVSCQQRATFVGTLGMFDIMVKNSCCSCPDLDISKVLSLTDWAFASAGIFCPCSFWD